MVNNPFNLDVKKFNQLTIVNQRYFDVFKTFRDIELNTYRRNLQPLDPFAVVRTREGDSYDKLVKVERYETAEENLLKDTNDGILQRFIRSKGRNRELDKYKTL
jgi:hypothetical protein